jgi:hypothetical protein
MPKKATHYRFGTATNHLKIPRLLNIQKGLDKIEMFEA